MKIGGAHFGRARWPEREFNRIQFYVDRIFVIFVLRRESRTSTSRYAVRYVAPGGEGGGFYSKILRVFNLYNRPISVRNENVVTGEGESGEIRRPSFTS